MWYFFLSVLRPCIFARVFFLTQRVTNMQLTLIKNTDMGCGLAYKVARVVYAETCASSLPVVEALTSMIANLSSASGREISSLISDSDLFESLHPESTNHENLYVSVETKAFQMCLRVAQRMLRGTLGDKCFGAIKFHRTEQLPQWAIARGYIADIDGLLFYL